MFLTVGKINVMITCIQCEPGYYALIFSKKHKQMLPKVYFYFLIITAQQYSLNCTGFFKGKIYQNIDQCSDLFFGRAVKQNYKLPKLMCHMFSRSVSPQAY